MLVPYHPEDSSSFYESYYSDQVGYGLSMPVYQGRTIMTGNGIGSVFSGLFRSALPMIKRGAKSIGKSLLSTGAGVLGDVMDGKSIKQAASSRFRDTGRGILGDLMGTLGAGKTTKGRVKKGKRKQTGRGIMRKNRKKLKIGIFDNPLSIL